MITIGLRTPNILSWLKTHRQWMSCFKNTQTMDGLAKNTQTMDELAKNIH